MKEDITTRRARALARLERAKAAMAAINARERASDRKRDTRRKILLGAALLSRASADAKFADLVTELVANLDRPVDCAAFEGWTVPKPAPVREAKAAHIAPTRPSPPARTRVAVSSATSPKGALGTANLPKADAQP